MARRIDKDHIDKYMETGLHIPSRTIHLSHEIDDDALTTFSKQLRLLHLGSTTADINLVVTCQGGDVTAGLAIHEKLSASPCHINCYIEGGAESVTTVILCAADTIYIPVRGYIMYHPGLTSLGDTPATEARHMFSLDQRLSALCDDIVYNKMAEKTPTLTRRKFGDQVTKGLVLVGQEAIDSGLATHIGVLP